MLWTVRRRSGVISDNAATARAKSRTQCQLYLSHAHPLGADGCLPFAVARIRPLSVFLACSPTSACTSLGRGPSARPTDSGVTEDAGETRHVVWSSSGFHTLSCELPSTPHTPGISASLLKITRLPRCRAWPLASRGRTGPPTRVSADECERLVCRGVLSDNFGTWATEPVRGDYTACLPALSPVVPHSHSLADRRRECIPGNRCLRSAKSGKV